MSALPLTFWALPPERVPSIGALKVWLDASLTADLRAFVGRSLPGLTGDARGALARLLDRLPPVEPLVSAAPSPMIGPGGFEMADDATHDRYFGVARVQGRAEGAFLRSVLEALRLFAEELALLPAGEDPGRFEPLGRGLLALLGAVLDVPVPPVEYSAPEVHAPTAESEPMRRWLHGHQIFLVLTQGITLALEEFERGARAGRTAAVSASALAPRAALQLATDLMIASAIAFRFAADFGPSVYVQTVRPSMAAGQIGEGFSGLLSVDHRALVSTMGRIRPLLQRAAARLPEREALVQALAHVYADHRFVCARFVGLEEPSLRCPSGTMASGVKQLDRLARARVRLLG